MLGLRSRVTALWLCRSEPDKTQGSKDSNSVYLAPGPLCNTFGPRVMEYLGSESHEWNNLSPTSQHPDTYICMSSWALPTAVSCFLMWCLSFEAPDPEFTNEGCGSETRSCWWVQGQAVESSFSKRRMLNHSSNHFSVDALYSSHGIYFLGKGQVCRGCLVTEAHRPSFCFFDDSGWSMSLGFRGI